MQKFIDLLEDEFLVRMIARKILRYIIMCYITWFIYQSLGGDIDIKALISQDKKDFNWETIIESILSYHTIIGFICLFVARIIVTSIEALIRFVFYFLIPLPFNNKTKSVAAELDKETNDEAINPFIILNIIEQKFSEKLKIFQGYYLELLNKVKAIILGKDPLLKLNEKRDEIEESIGGNKEALIELVAIATFFLFFLNTSDLIILKDHNSWLIWIKLFIWIYTIFNLVLLVFTSVLENYMYLFIDLGIKYQELKQTPPNTEINNNSENHSVSQKPSNDLSKIVEPETKNQDNEEQQLKEMN